MFSIPPNRRRWIIVAIIFGAMMLNYIDRVTISFLKAEIMDMFQLDNLGYGRIASVFTFFYAVMYPVSGWLIDRYGRGDGVRLLMFGGVVVWSFACVSAVFTRVVWTFGASRALLGAAEPMAYAAQIRAITEWFPKKLRATANSLCVAGGTIGMVIAPPILVGLKMAYGWQAVFLVPGVLGLVIAAFWFVIYRNPPAKMLAENIGATASTSEPAFGWLELWKTRTLWGVILIRFISDPVWYFCLFWLPGYLKSVNLSESFSAIPFLCAAIGGIGSGIISDRMVRAGMAPLRARKLLLTVTAVAMPLFALTPHVSNAVFTIAVFSLVCAICLSWLFNIPVLMSETFPTRNVAGVLGIAAGCGAFGSVLFNEFVGRAFDKGVPASVFAVMGGLHLVASVILWTATRPEKPSAA